MGINTVDAGVMLRFICSTMATKSLGWKVLKERPKATQGPEKNPTIKDDERMQSTFQVSIVKPIVGHQ